MCCSEIGYAIEFRVPLRKRDKIADQLTWLINKDRLGLFDEREAERRIGGGQVVATFGDGVSVACSVVDVSIFGVALQTAGPRPMIGDRSRSASVRARACAISKAVSPSTSAPCTPSRANRRRPG